MGSFILLIMQLSGVLGDYACLPFDTCISWLAVMCFSFLVNLMAMITAFNRYGVFILLEFNRTLKQTFFPVSGYTSI